MKYDTFALTRTFCVPDLKRIAVEVKRQRPNALMIVFAKDADLQPFESSAYDVVGVRSVDR